MGAWWKTTVTLTTVPQYDPARISDRDGRAVVVGAGMAGLLTARVLADMFDEVTVIDRDLLPDELEPRRGIPQGNHVHVLLEAGRATIEDLIPGYSQELIDAGGVVSGGQDIHMYLQDEWFTTTDTNELYLATRPLYEHLAHRRVALLNRVNVRSQCQFVEYHAEDPAVVEGVVVRNRNAEQEVIAADLVVDATGRTSRTPVWLEEHGYTPPAVDEISIDIGYASAFIERPSDEHRAISMEAQAPRTRGAFVFPVEGDRWLCNLHGMHGDHPPTDPESYKEFAASLPTPVVHDLLEAHSMVSDIAFYPFPSNRRYRYEDLERFPAGLVVVGDAVASFNPVHGQGMSVAALEAALLHQVLASTDRTTLAPRFFDTASDVIGVAWDLSVGVDLAFEQTEGTLPRRMALFDWYLNRLLRRSRRDPLLADLMWAVYGLVQPPSILFRPRVIWRVLGPPHRARGQPSTEQPVIQTRGDSN